MSMNSKHMRDGSRCLAPRCFTSFLVRSACSATLLVASASAQNLILNSSFESGLTGWTVVSGAASTVTYGSPSAPSASVSSQIGGLGQLARDSSGSSILEQIVATGAIPAGTNVRVEGFLGGLSNDGAKLVVRFLNASNGEIQRREVGTVTAVDRNGEAVLMLRRATFAPPAGTLSIALRVEFAYSCCSSATGAADELSLELVGSPLTPPPLPLDAELLVNGSFEQGWAPGSPLTLVDAQGWFGGASATCTVKPYSNVDTSVPTTQVGALIQGGANLLSDAGGNAVLFQRLDVRGNAPFTPSVVLKLSAFPGGASTDTDRARVDAIFRNSSGVVLDTRSIGPVTRAQRNSSTILMKRVGEFPIPSDTATIDVRVAFEYLSCCEVRGLVDRVSAKLGAPTPPQPVLSGANLVHNGNFEDGPLPGLALDPNDPSGWQGVNDGSVEQLTYGTSFAPPTSLAIGEGLGGQLLGDGSGDSGLYQDLDLRGASATVIAGRMRLAASVELGGLGADIDNAFLQLQFLNDANVQVGGTGGLVQTPPVTAADRGNVTTLLNRSADVPVPSSATHVLLTLQFDYISCCEANGLADNVIVIAYDALTESFPTCFGDGTATDCPCGNNSIAGRGCANSTNPAGSLLGLSGSPLTDNITLVGSGMPATSTCIYFQGSTWNVGGTVFGDGLRCADGTIIRLNTKTNSGGASQFPEPGDPSVSIRGQVTPGNGEIRVYQAFYRNSTANFCPPLTFNVTNAWVVVW